MAMNVSVSAPAVGTPGASASGGLLQGGGVSSGKAAASSGGFAGVLVAAIGGEAAAGTGSGALTAPSAAALLPGLLTEPAGEAEQDGQMGDRLLAALNKLLGQLRPLVQEDKTDGTSGQQGELADLLAVIQALFLQLQASRSAAAEPGAADGTALAQTGETALSSLPADMLENLFRQTKQLSEALSQGSAPSGDASALAEGLKLASAALADNGEARAAASEGPKAGVQTAAEGLADIRQQPAGQETGRKVAAFREPILMWNWAAEANDARPDATGPQADGISERPQPEGGHAPLAVPAMNASAVPSLETAARTGVPVQVPVQQFSREIGGFLVKQFVLHNGNGLTEARISLHPEHLGHVDVRIVMQEGQMTAQFVAQNGTAKELIENQLNTLRAALQNQGIQVERIEVVQHSELQDTASFSEQERRHSGSGREEQYSSRTGRDSSLEEIGDFEDELARSNGLKEIGYGSSLNVIA